MTTHERSTLKRLAARLRSDADFAEKVARDPQSALGRYALTAAQKAAVYSLALSITSFTFVGVTTSGYYWY
jgi:hypothetical protein